MMFVKNMNVSNYFIVKNVEVHFFIQLGRYIKLRIRARCLIFI